MTVEQVVERLGRSNRPRGRNDGRLRIGGWSVRLAGLDDALAESLRRRWGAFLAGAGRAADEAPDADVELCLGDPSPWLSQRPGEAYRLEGAVTGGRLVVWSYAFAAVARAERPARWRAALADPSVEPAERAVDNLARYLVARLAAARGGFAIHGAGVLREGRAWLFAGASGTGKSTAVRLSSPAPGLGDDFAIAVPREGGWSSAAVPFDNSEHVTAEPPRGWIPLAGIWRLYRADAPRVEDLPAGRAAASLMACAAFPWAMPDRLSSLLESTGRFAADGLFHHLHFARRPDFWGPLGRSAADV